MANQKAISPEALASALAPWLQKITALDEDMDYILASLQAINSRITSLEELSISSSLQSLKNRVTSLETANSKHGWNRLWYGTLANGQSSSISVNLGNYAVIGAKVAAASTPNSIDGVMLVGIPSVPKSTGEVHATAKIDDATSTHIYGVSIKYTASTIKLLAGSAHKMIEGVTGYQLRLKEVWGLTV